MKKTAEEFQKEITNSILESLKNDEQIFWRRPWTDDSNSGAPTSLSSGKPYSGINNLILLLASWKNQFDSKYFATYNAIQHEGGQVRRGSKGIRIVCYRPVTKKKINKSGLEERTTYFVQKNYVVFNVAAQCENMEQYKVGFSQPTIQLDDRFAEAQKFVDSIQRVTIDHGGNSACCVGSFIKMPHIAQFTSQFLYMETLCHELIHTTEVFLNWDRQGEGYQMGELIAEIGSVFLLQRLQLPYDSNMQQHVSYLRSWIPEAAKNDPKLIFRAASQASKAVNWLIENSCLKTEVEPVAEEVPF